MKYTTSLLLALYCLFYTSCNKNKNTDSAYFSCYINGQYFEPEKQKGLGEYPVTAKLLYDGIDLRIDVSKGVQNVYIGIKDTNKVKTQQYILSNNMGYFSRAMYYPTISANHYETDSIFMGIATISLLDTKNRVVQGTFHFDAFSPPLNDTVHITNGKFKLKYDLH